MLYIIKKKIQMSKMYTAFYYFTREEKKHVYFIRGIANRKIY